MIYLHDGHIRELGVDWRRLAAIIVDAASLQDEGDCAHPLKPYLRFGDPVNRIIAMPAYVGGSFRMAGIKWIASFPHNAKLSLPRAHNTIILNDPATGAPVAFFNSGLLSGLRTAAVSGAMTGAFIKEREPLGIRLGIIGWGPIGRLHLDMMASLFGDMLERVWLYDLRGIDPESIPARLRPITRIAEDWRTLYRSSSVIATCTVSASRYIDEAPPAGTLLLNVSLRDYYPQAAAGIRAVVVDDWTEVCRENTDIEQLHLQCGLTEAVTSTLADVLCRSALNRYAADEPVFFNPMGLAIFDIAMACQYWRDASRRGIGEQLDRGPVLL